MLERGTTTEVGVLAARPPYLVAAGLASILVGIGLARFAYTPLVPVLIDHGWFSNTGAAYLGAANLAGYLVGAYSARWVTGRVAIHQVIKWMMATVAVSFVACSVPLPFAWFFVWRLASGIAGGMLMILGPSLVLGHVPIRLRGVAGGFMFAGVGLGIVISATIVPVLAAASPTIAWLVFGGISLLATGAAWGAWPRTEPEVRAPSHSEANPGRQDRSSRLRTTTLNIAYAMAAVGLVAHMVFLVDYIARGLEWGLEAGAGYWVLFGVGACLGPVLAGFSADRLGFKLAFRFALAVECLGVGVLVWEPSPVVLGLSSLVVGGLVPGIVPLALGRLRELAVSEAVGRTAWSTATTAFAIGQAAAGYSYSYLFDRTGSYELLFAIGAVALFIAVLLEVCGDMASNWIERRRPGSEEN